MATNKVKFTGKNIFTLPAPPKNGNRKEIEYTDTIQPCLMLSVSKNGSRSFRYRRTVGKKHYFVTIGSAIDYSVEDARKKASEYSRNIDDGRDPRTEIIDRRTKPTLAEFYDKEYTVYATQEKKSCHTDFSKFNHHMRKPLGEYRIDCISHITIEEYLSSVKPAHHEIAANLPPTASGRGVKRKLKKLAMKNKLSDSTLNRHISLLSAIFRYAQQKGYIESNPCSLVRKRKEASLSDATQRALTSDELVCLIKAIKKERNRVAGFALSLLCNTGLRLNEALYLKWTDVNLEKGTILLRQTKTTQNRTVALNDSAIDNLKQLQALKAADMDEKCAKRAGDKIVLAGNKKRTAVEDWVFYNKDRSFDRFKDLRKTLMRCTEAAGISRHVRIHDIRHTFATMALANGVDSLIVKDLLGHSSISTTLRYAKPTAEMVRERATPMNDALAKIWEKSDED